MTELCLRLNRGLSTFAASVHSCPAFIACYHEDSAPSATPMPDIPRPFSATATGVAELGSTGLPLGLFSHATCEAPTVGMEKGACSARWSLAELSTAKATTNQLEDSAWSGSSDFLSIRIPATAAGTCAASSWTAVARVRCRTGPVCDDRTALALIRTA